MPFNSAEEKLRYLAQGYAPLAAFLAGNPFRWFMTQQQPGYSTQGTVVRVRRPGAVYTQVQEGQLCTEQVRLQFDCIDQSETVARQCLNALYGFIQQVDLMSDAQFRSPPVTPTQFPNYQLSQRGPTIEYDASLQLWVWSADWRVFNNLLIA